MRDTVFRKTGIHGQAVSAAAQGLHKLWIIGVIIERVTKLADRVREGFVTCVAISPDFRQQFFMRHHIARPRSEMQQHLDSFGPYVSGLTPVGNQPFERFDQYIAQVEALYQCGLQLFFTFVPGRPNDNSPGDFRPNIIYLRDS